MNSKIATNLRKWFSLLAAVLLYYLVHEGSHLLVACIYGTFQGIKFMGLGVQIVADTAAMTNLQLAIFCVVGSIAALAVGEILLLLTAQIVSVKNKYVKAIGYYTTLVLLLADPIYLSVLYRFVGGGDMNGILLFGIPEPAVQLIYGAVGVCNLFLLARCVYPKYKKAFVE